MNSSFTSTILTFDFEEWYNQVLPYKVMYGYKNLPGVAEIETTKFLDFLDINKVKCTFFILGTTAVANENILLEIASRGHELGIHSYYHNNIQFLNEYEFEKELVLTKSLIYKITGLEVKLYRAPSFSMNEMKFDFYKILIKNGITISSSIFPVKRNNGGIKNKYEHDNFLFKYKNKELYEYPMTKCSLFGLNKSLTGGGYLRLLPLGLIRYIFYINNINMLYIHPHDLTSSFYYNDNVGIVKNICRYIGSGESMYKKLNYIIKIRETIPLASYHDIKNKSLKYNIIELND